MCVQLNVQQFMLYSTTLKADAGALNLEQRMAPPAHRLEVAARSRAERESLCLEGFATMLVPEPDPQYVLQKQDREQIVRLLFYESKSPGLNHRFTTVHIGLHSKKYKRVSRITCSIVASLGSALTFIGGQLMYSV